MSADNRASYFMVTQSDGDVCIRQLTHDEAVERLIVNESGELLHEPWRPGEQFDSDPSYWPRGKHLIIRGEIVTPTPVSVKYEFR